mgnify:FL=1
MPKATQTAEFWINAIESLPENATWNDLIDRTPSYAQNATTGTHYKGSNLVTIAIDKWINGFQSNYYVTYNAVKFNKDAKFKDYDGTKKGIPVTKWGIQCRECKIEFNMYGFWKNADRGKCECPTETPTKPIVHVHTVYNLDLIEGIETPSTEHIEFNIIEEAEAIVKGFADKPSVHHDGNGRAYYSPSEDRVHMPKKNSFKSDDAYYAVLFHELTHSTGHKSRVSRELDKIAKFGDSVYAREELVAEIGSAMLCRMSGIESNQENSTAYLKNWLGALKNDSSLIHKAVKDAQRAVDYITNK